MALECVQQHLTGLELANRQLSESERKYRGLFEHAPVGIFHANADGKLTSVNRAMLLILGCDSPEAAAENACRPDGPFALLMQAWKAARHPDVECQAQPAIEVQMRAVDGAAKWVHFHVCPILQDGKPQGFEGIAEDITERKAQETKTETLAYYDLMTGLPNRTLFRERLTETLEDSRAQGRRSALLYLEIDRFRVINDSLGTAVGDRLLQEFAARIRSGTRDDAIVARVGDAEFAILLPSVVDSGEVLTIAKSLAAMLNGEHSFLGHSLSVACNIGISIFPEHGVDGETLLTRSDVALCFAREGESSRVRAFTAEMNDNLTERLVLDHGLRKALAQHELYLVYQPQVDLRTGAVTGLEALLRWKHNRLGIVPPNKFIEVAENNGLIVPIGEWVLRSACSQARVWQMKGLPVVPVAVNVSAVQFRQQDFCDVVRDVLYETGLEPRLLELELTESLLLTDADQMSSVAARLRDMGVTLAIDDFGTGYCSLSYLKHFKVNRLKIDRSFIRDVPVDADDAAITIAIIEMARALNMEVLAEGVEKEDQLEFLYNQQCFTAQGFYFSKPALADEIDQRLQNGFGHLIQHDPEHSTYVQ